MITWSYPAICNMLTTCMRKAYTLRLLFFTRHHLLCKDWQEWLSNALLMERSNFHSKNSVYRTGSKRSETLEWQFASLKRIRRYKLFNSILNKYHGRAFTIMEIIERRYNFDQNIFFDVKFYSFLLFWSGPCSHLTWNSLLCIRE